MEVYREGRASQSALGDLLELAILTRNVRAKEKRVLGRREGGVRGKSIKKKKKSCL